MIDKVRLSNRISELRKKNQQMRQIDLAVKAGVTRQTIIALEAERYSPSLLLAYRIAKALDTNIEDVFLFDDES